MGRLGLWLQVTSDLGHLGTCHHWTLELNVVQPLRVYAGMRIGQVTFWVPRGSRELSYEGAYADDDSAALSSIYREFANQ
jgi:dCTP deaminase